VDTPNSPPKPETPEQIATWVVEDVWNKGDFRLASQLLKPTVVLHYRGQAFPLTPESATQTVQTWRNVSGLSFQTRRPDRAGK
jgi:hypothetical protein